MELKRLSQFALVFAAGMGAGYFMRAPLTTGAGSHSTATALATATSPLPIAKAGVADRIKTTQASVAKNSSVIHHPESTESALDPEEEIRLREFVSSPAPSGRETGRDLQPDGSTLVTEELTDGSLVHKIFDPEGRLVGANWGVAPESFQQDYYFSGQVKSAFWNRENSYTVLGFTEAGRYQYRTDATHNGKLVSTLYDHRGQVKEVRNIDESPEASPSPAPEE